MTHVRSVLRWTGSLVGLAGVAFSLTLLFQSMRAVQSIGGFCASGGPYQIAHSCPKGTAGLLPLSIVGGLIFLGLFVICAGDEGSGVAKLAWPALFLSLGWNFLDYGLHLTVAGGGVNGGFLACGVLFIVMGAVPLVWWIPELYGELIGKDDAPSPAAPTPSFGSSGVGFTSTTSAAPWAGFGGTSMPMSPQRFSTSPAPSAPPRDVAAQLERLASLHHRGELSDSEYEAAKQQALGQATS